MTGSDPSLLPGADTALAAEARAWIQALGSERRLSPKTVERF